MNATPPRHLPLWLIAAPMLGALVHLGCSSSDDSAPERDAGLSGEEQDAGLGGEEQNEGNDGAPESGDAFVSDVDVQVHERVNTLLVVTWTQVMPADQVFLEFSFEGDEFMTSRPVSGTEGAHRDVALGVPSDTDVTIRVVSQVGDAIYRSGDHLGRTGPLPQRMPQPTEVMHDPTLASPDRFMLGAVEDSDGGCTNTSCYYHTTFWLYIMDRRGRIVWYYADPASNATSSFQRIARDGEYIWIEKRPFGFGANRSVLKMSLDWEYYEEIPVDNLSDCIDVTDDGSLLYDTIVSNPSGGPSIYTLTERTRDDRVRSIWRCSDHFDPGPSGNNCYSNTINWNPLDDTVLLSFPYQGTVVEIDRQTGNEIGRYGNAAGSYTFDPSPWSFEFQHFANITMDGTLLVSSHLPGYSDTRNPRAGFHAFEEFTIDRQSRTLIQKWIYNEGPEWAMFKGMAIRLPNGNTLANYGTGGVIREITPDKETAFYVKFDVPERTTDFAGLNAPEDHDFFNKMVGHNVLLDDLYALNGGPQ